MEWPLGAFAHLADQLYTSPAPLSNAGNLPGSVSVQRVGQKPGFYASLKRNGPRWEGFSWAKGVPLAKKPGFFALKGLLPFVSLRPGVFALAVTLLELEATPAGTWVVAAGVGKAALQLRLFLRQREHDVGRGATGL